MRDDDITELLAEWGKGDSEALTQVIPLVADELYKLAKSHFRKEAPGHTLQPTALVNEVYLRLAGQLRVRLGNRSQFFALASRLMRRILVDHYRARRASKRGHDQTKITFDEAIGPRSGKDIDLLALDDALESLRRLDPRLARLVELRFFGGLTLPETSQILGLSVSSVKREWTSAKAFLARELQPAR